MATPKSHVDIHPIPFAQLPQSHAVAGTLSVAEIDVEAGLFGPGPLKLKTDTCTGLCVCCTSILSCTFPAVEVHRIASHRIAAGTARFDMHPSKFTCIQLDSPSQANY